MTENKVVKRYCVVCAEITEWEDISIITFSPDSDMGENNPNLVCKKCRNPDVSKGFV